MTKRKKANNAPSRPTRGKETPEPSGDANAALADTPAQIVENPSVAEPATRAPPPTTGPQPAVLALAAECLVGGASALKGSLASLLDEPRPITLDITSLQRIDTAGVQVLTAFVRERAGHGRAVEWLGTAPALTTAAHLLGLTALLRLPA